MTFMENIMRELTFQKNLCKQFSTLKKIRSEGEVFCKIKKQGYKEFYIKRPDSTRRRYIKKSEMDQVYKLQMKKIGETGFNIAENNIKLLEQVLSGYKSCSLKNIMGELPEAYRMCVQDYSEWSHFASKRPFPQSENPYRREDLRHTTSFGLLTRSKSEAQIAEQLATAGAQLEFYYEKALALITEDGRPRTIYPDFTIILPDGRTIYWEHKGMLDFPEYAQRDLERTLLYFRNGIYQPHNLIVTCDGPGGSYPGVEIAEIIEKILFPHDKSRF